MIPALIALGILISSFITINVWYYRLTRNGEWHKVFPDKMRRMTDAGWEYRPMTDQEYADDFNARAY